MDENYMPRKRRPSDHPIDHDSDGLVNEAETRKQNRAKAKEGNGAKQAPAETPNERLQRQTRELVEENRKEEERTIQRYIERLRAAGVKGSITAWLKKNVSTRDRLLMKARTSDRLERQRLGKPPQRGH